MLANFNISYKLQTDAHRILPWSLSSIMFSDVRVTANIMFEQLFEVSFDINDKLKNFCYT